MFTATLCSKKRGATGLHLAWLGSVRFGSVRFGSARLGSARLGSARHGTERNGTEKHRISYSWLLAVLTVAQKFLHGVNTSQYKSSLENNSRNISFLTLTSHTSLFFQAEVFEDLTLWVSVYYRDRPTNIKGR
jgi:hypothetical protein